MPERLLVVSSLAAIVSSAVLAQGEVLQWTGNNADANGLADWGDAGNWLPQRIPSNVDDVVFTQGGSWVIDTERGTDMYFVNEINVESGSVVFPWDYGPVANVLRIGSVGQGRPYVSMQTFTDQAPGRQISVGVGKDVAGELDLHGLIIDMDIRCGVGGGDGVLRIDGPLVNTGITAGTAGGEADVLIQGLDSQGGNQIAFGNGRLDIRSDLSFDDSVSLIADGAIHHATVAGNFDFPFSTFTVGATNGGLNNIIFDASLEDRGKSSTFSIFGRSGGRTDLIMRGLVNVFDASITGSVALRIDEGDFIGINTSISLDPDSVIDLRSASLDSGESLDLDGVLRVREGSSLHAGEFFGRGTVVVDGVGSSITESFPFSSAYFDAIYLTNGGFADAPGAAVRSGIADGSGTSMRIYLGDVLAALDGGSIETMYGATRGLTVGQASSFSAQSLEFDSVPESIFLPARVIESGIRLPGATVSLGRSHPGELPTLTLLTREGVVRRYRNSGGYLPQLIIEAEGSLGYAPSAAVIADVNGDEVDDFVAVDEASGELAFHIRQSPSELVFETQRLQSGMSGAEYEVTPLLVASDGGRERVLVTSSDGGAALAWLDETGAANVEGLESSLGGGVATLAADLNSDGTSEIVVARDEEDVVEIWTLGSQGRGLSAVLAATISVPRPVGLEDADLDTDGSRELLVLSSGELVELTFTQPMFAAWVQRVAATAIDREQIRAVDADDDGDEDVFAAGRRTGLLFLENQSQGVLLPARSVESGVGLIQDIGSLTNSPTPDLVVANLGGEVLTLRQSALNGPVSGAFIDCTHGATLAVDVGPILNDSTTLLLRDPVSGAGGIQSGGAATLDGVLVVTGEIPEDPPLGSTFEILSAAGGLGGTRFDAAILPGLPSGKFLRLHYQDGGPARGAGSVTLLVDTLKGPAVGVDPQDPSPLPGLPEGAALGDVAAVKEGVVAGPDGLPDLVVAIPDDANPTGAPGQVAVLINAGTGVDGVWDGFSGGTLIISTQPGGEQPVSVNLGDLDNDKDLDLLTANSSGSSVTAIINDGTGGLAALTPVAAGVDRPRAIAVGDLDGDGRADAAVVGSNASGTAGQIAGLVSSGAAGGFLPPATQSIGGSHAWASLGDLDNDKDLDLDLLVADSGSSAVHAFENLGGLGAAWSGLSLRQTIPVGTGVVQASLGDLDNDKDLDFLTANRTAGTASLGINDGTGFFGAASSLPIGTRPRSLAFADLDQDGDDDVAVIVDDDNEPGERLVRVLRNDLDTPGGQLILTTALAQPSDLRPRIALSDAATLTSGVTTRDLDGDGDDDLVTVNEDPPSARSGARGSATASAEALLQGFGLSPCPADLNGTGTVDAADLAILIGSWGLSGAADFDGDGVVGAADLATLVGSWGPCFD